VWTVSLPPRWTHCVPAPNPGVLVAEELCLSCPAVGPACVRCFKCRCAVRPLKSAAGPWPFQVDPVALQGLRAGISASPGCRQVVADNRLCAGCPMRQGTRLGICARSVSGAFLDGCISFLAVFNTRSRFLWPSLRFCSTLFWRHGRCLLVVLFTRPGAPGLHLFPQRRFRLRPLSPAAVPSLPHPASRPRHEGQDLAQPQPQSCRRKHHPTKLPCNPQIRSCATTGLQKINNHHHQTPSPLPQPNTREHRPEDAISTPAATMPGFADSFWSTDHAAGKPVRVDAPCKTSRRAD
jgi:hypothetical protein